MLSKKFLTTTAKYRKEIGSTTFESIKLVVAGCARDCAEQLPNTLNFIEILSSEVGTCATIIVENDSIDETKPILKQWASKNRLVTVLTQDGLHEKYPNRSERIAAARNKYLEYVHETPLAGYDYLLILDMDGPVGAQLSVSNVLKAIHFLKSSQDIAACFANSTPVYYDIWALRHPIWCPSDCWQEYQELKRQFGHETALHRAINDRQIPISTGEDTIFVQSAFGGLGIYKISQLGNARYEGIAADGTPVSEHVPFNLYISKHAKLALIPNLLVQAPLEHIITGSNDTRTIQVTYNDNSARLLVPADHKLDLFQAHHPLYDRRLPLLAKLLSAEFPDSYILDVGSNVGDTALAIRLTNCLMPILGIEASPYFIRFAEINKRRNPTLFTEVDFTWALAGAGLPEGELLVASGTAHLLKAGVAGHERKFYKPRSRSLSDLSEGRDVVLLKTDTDGFDHHVLREDLKFLKKQKPIIWSEAQTTGPVDESAWSSLLDEMAATWPYVIYFDNYGFSVASGETSSKVESIIDFIRYCRRQRNSESKNCGDVRTYYADIALFPKWAENVARLFVNELCEMQDASTSLDRSDVKLRENTLTERWTLLRKNLVRSVLRHKKAKW